MHDELSASAAPVSQLQSRPHRSIFWMSLYLGTMASLGPLAIDMYLPAFPRIATAFSVQISDVQRTLASYFIGLAIGQLIYGPLADRFGRKPPLYFGLILFTLCSAGCALTWNIPSLTLLRFMQALGGCAEMVIARAIVRDLYDDRQSARVFSSLMLVMGLAPILAPLIGGFLASHFDWRMIFWLVTAAGLATLASTAFLFHESLPPERRIRQSASEVIRTYLSLTRYREFMLQAMTVGIAMGGLFAYVGGSPYVFEKIFHISESRFGFYFGPIACGIIGMSQVNGVLAGRFDIRKVLRVALIVHCAAGITLLIDALTGFGGFWGIFFPLWFLIASMGFVFPNTTVLAMSPLGRIAGSASAVLGFFQFGISAGVGVIVSAIQNAQTTPTPMPMAGTIAICSTMALICNFFTHPGRIAPSASDEAEGSFLAAEQ